MAPGNIPCPSCAVAIPFWHNQCPLCGYMLIQAKATYDDPRIIPTTTPRPVVAALSDADVEDMRRLHAACRHPRPGDPCSGCIWLASLDAARQATREAERERDNLETDAVLLRDSYRELEIDVTKLRAQLAEAQGELVATQPCVDEAREYASRAQAEARELRQERNQLRAQLAEARAEVETYKARWEKAEKQSAWTDARLLDAETRYDTLLAAYENARPR